MNKDNWLLEIGALLEDCVDADSNEAGHLVKRFLHLMRLAPTELQRLIIESDTEADSQFFELPALESLLLSQLGDAIGMCLSISASKSAIATAFDHRTELETTFQSEHLPVAMAGAIAMLAAKGVQSEQEPAKGPAQLPN